ncbi:MAG: hypothetical protein J4473_05790 [Candidatus Aenigmarchaeota archaeon]|nr:hypothetical protein [Candidatus Aenigmarchaeota archaeon]
MTADPFRAYRQFLLLLPGMDPNRLPDDRKTWDDVFRYPRPASPHSESEEGELIVVIHYFPDKEKIVYERC